MPANFNDVLLGFFIIGNFIAAIFVLALAINRRVERAEAKRRHPSNGGTGLDSPEFKY